MYEYPIEIEAMCPQCSALTYLEQTSTRGLYQGYCEESDCGEWFEYNYDELLESEAAEQAMEAARERRLGI